jgi:hypothetical protein
MMGPRQIEQGVLFYNFSLLGAVATTMDLEDLSEIVVGALACDPDCRRL